MRRNNHVFLFGSVRHYLVHALDDQGDPSLIDLRLVTERKDQQGAHRVLVRGQQAVELQTFFDLTSPRLPELAILGWLRSQEGTATLVMAERVTVVVDAQIRRAAAQALRERREVQAVRA